MLEINSLKKTYHQNEKDIPVIRNIELRVGNQEKIAIMGKSGSGKSTFLSLVSGIIKPDAGEIVLNDHRYESLSEAEMSDMRASQIGFVFQNFQLISYLNALENVMLPGKVCGISNPEEKASRLLEQVGLSDRLDHRPSELSGGEKQRVAIARSLIHSPPLILADEPSGSLDEETGETVMNLLFEMVNQSGASLVLVTHEKSVANRCEKIYQLHDGQLHLMEE